MSKAQQSSGSTALTFCVQGLLDYGAVAPKVTSASALMKHRFLRSAQNHLKWFSDDKSVSSVPLGVLLLSITYLQTKWVCFVSECNQPGK